jgi:curved DNA-binding protein CbpA
MTTRTMTPPPFVDLYAALELEKGASSGAIKKAYRALALRWHPDKNAGDAEAHARFQDIGKAYAVLSDPKKRAYYDTTGDVEDIDVSADDFVSTFVAMMDELLGGGTIEDMLDGLGDADFASMPPFPFPKHLFPPDTFPENMRFSEDFHVPPAVAELVEREGPEALQRMVVEHRDKHGGKKGRGSGSGRMKKNRPGFGDGDSDESDERTSDSSRSSEWESDDGAEPSSRGRDRRAGTRHTPRSSRRNKRFGGGGRRKRSLLRALLRRRPDDEMDDSELDALMRSMPPEMFEQLLREDARGGGEAGEEAAALVALLEEMGEMGLEGLGLPPELAGLAGRARAGGRLSGESARGAFSRGAGAGPAGPGEGGGGGGGAGARRARARHAGQSAFRRGKKGGSPGTRPAPAARADADDAIPAVAGSGDVDSSARGSRTEKNRRKKARKKEKEKETTSFSSQRVTTQGDDSLSEPHVGDAKPVPIKWAPDASRKTEARETEKNDFVDREVSRRWVAAAKAGDVNALRLILEETDTVSSFTNDDEKKKTNAKRTMLAHRSPGIGHTALHWTSSRGADALDATFFSAD